MASPPSKELTRLLVDWSNGDQAALDELMPLVYAELRKLARHYMRGERSGHTLQTTALVNEAYLRLVDQRSVRWQNRAHFFAIAAQVMRRLLVDHARTQKRAKRGGGGLQISLDEAMLMAPGRSAELLALDEALNNLAELDPRKSRVVELRHFGGLSVEEAAEVLQVSPNTVIRDWSLARAWLRREVETGSGDEG